MHIFLNITVWNKIAVTFETWKSAKYLVWEIKDDFLSIQTAHYIVQLLLFHVFSKKWFEYLNIIFLVKSISNHTDRADLAWLYLWSMEYGLVSKTFDSEFGAVFRIWVGEEINRGMYLLKNANLTLEYNTRSASGQKKKRKKERGKIKPVQ